MKSNNGGSSVLKPRKLVKQLLKFILTPGHETCIFQENQVNIGATDALAPCVAMPSVAMILNIRISSTCAMSVLRNIKNANVQYTRRNRSGIILPLSSPNNVFRNYRKTSCISRTKSPNLDVSCLVLQLSLPNPLKPGVKLRTKMSLEQRRQRCYNYIWVINNHVAY